MNNQTLQTNTLGFYAAILTAITTIVTFGIAIFTPPLSGPYCKGNCFIYPYADIASRFPRDYIWMYPAILLLVFYAVLMVCIHYYASEDKKIYSHIGLFFAFSSALILITDYFIQISVIQPSLLNGETDGVAMLTQFNPHGIFIVLEDLGYLLMGIAFLFMAPVFSEGRIKKSIRWIFISAFALTIVSFILYSVIYGVNREYRFEVVSISINWLALIVSSILLSIVFRKSLQH